MVNWRRTERWRWTWTTDIIFPSHVHVSRGDKIPECHSKFLTSCVASEISIISADADAAFGGNENSAQNGSAHSHTNCNIGAPTGRVSATMSPLRCSRTLRSNSFSDGDDSGGQESDGGPWQWPILQTCALYLSQLDPNCVISIMNSKRICVSFFSWCSYHKRFVILNQHSKNNYIAREREKKKTMCASAAQQTILECVRVVFVDIRMGRSDSFTMLWLHPWKKRSREMPQLRIKTVVPITANGQTAHAYHMPTPNAPAKQDTHGQHLCSRFVYIYPPMIKTGGLKKRIQEEMST